MQFWKSAQEDFGPVASPEKAVVTDSAKETKAAPLEAVQNHGLSDSFAHIRKRLTSEASGSYRLAPCFRTKKQEFVPFLNQRKPWKSYSVSLSHPLPLFKDRDDRPGHRKSPANRQNTEFGTNLTGA